MRVLFAGLPKEILVKQMNMKDDSETDEYHRYCYEACKSRKKTLESDREYHTSIATLDTKSTLRVLIYSYFLAKAIGVISNPSLVVVVDKTF